MHSHTEDFVFLNKLLYKKERCSLSRTHIFLKYSTKKYPTFSFSLSNNGASPKYRKCRHVIKLSPTILHRKYNETIEIYEEG